MQQTTQTLFQIPLHQSHQNAIEQLNLSINQSNKQDQQQLLNILTKILTYPSTQLAQIHMNSDRLGGYDVQKQILIKNQFDLRQKNQVEFCACCGFLKQNQLLKLCTNFININNIGISTFLYFYTIKNLIILLTIMTLIYSIFSLTTNIIASNLYSDHNTTLSSLKSDVSYVSLSLGSKHNNPTIVNQAYYYIQCWLGVTLLCIWLIMLYILKYLQRQKQIRTQKQTISAADFTILIQNIPKDITLNQLQQSFNLYYQKLKQYFTEYQILPFNIVKISIGKPFYLNQNDYQDKQLTKLKQKHLQQVQSIISLIKQRKNSFSFSTVKSSRQSLYKQYQQTLQSQCIKYNQLGQKIIQKIKEQSHTEQPSTTVFVTFQYSQSMKIITKYNDPSFLSIIRYYLTFKKGHHRFKFFRGPQKQKIKIQRAPQPQDVIWTNLGVSTIQIFKRKAITFTSTIILLGISFVIAYLLSRVQHDQSSNQILSLVISICLSLMNIIIGLCIRQLSLYQKDYTLTKYQTSLAIKSILAALINSIFIPIMVNYYIKDNIYGQNGLASDVFMLGLTNSFLAPILKIIDLTYIYNRLNKSWYSRPYNKIYLNQRQLNNNFQFMVFQVGYQYVYLVSLFMFTCFFVSLQPIISIFAICGMGLMYWTQKYSLFYKMKRPVPGTNLVNVTMFQILLFSGLFYSLGSLTWSNFMPDGTPSNALLPNLIAVGISIGLILMPYTTILSLCLKQVYSSDLQYSKSRILLPSQYDRLNPSQSQQALKQFKQFYDNKLKQLQNTSQKDKQNFFKQLFKQGARGHHQPYFNKKFNPFNVFMQNAHQSNQLFQITQQLIPKKTNYRKKSKDFSPFLQLFQPVRQNAIPNNYPYSRQYQPQQQQYGSFNPLINLLGQPLQHFMNHQQRMNNQQPPPMTSMQYQMQPQQNFTQIYPIPPIPSNQRFNNHGGQNFAPVYPYPQYQGNPPPPPPPPPPPYPYYQGVPMQPPRPGFGIPPPPPNSSQNFGQQQQPWQPGNGYYKYQ